MAEETVNASPDWRYCGHDVSAFITQYQWMGAQYIDPTVFVVQGPTPVRRADWVPIGVATCWFPLEWALGAGQSHAADLTGVRDCSFS